ncbi:MAG: hypothetical protein LBT51_05240 [Fusobacteriaceae bacterium]|jgi:hypothetical protein|nr:hypothetical protein [Fusobacteriaceae bacterium]
MKQIYIYSKDAKLLTSLYAEDDYLNNIKKYYPSYEKTQFITENKLNNPIIDNGSIREKTREEQIILDKKYDLLLDGEYVDNGSIIIVEKNVYLRRPIWDKNTKIWKETLPIEELIVHLRDNILQKKFDDTAKAIGFGDTLFAGTYLRSNTPSSLKSKAEAFFDWRDSQWLKMEQLQNTMGAQITQSLQSGQAVFYPTDEEILSMLDPFIYNIYQES